MASIDGRSDSSRLVRRQTLRGGTLAGLAMIPFAAVFRSLGLRVNEYGRKTLAILVGNVEPPLHQVLTFVQHLMISWIAAVPFLMLAQAVPEGRARLCAGALYGAGFYVAINSLALPLAFGDPTPWQLGHATVVPSLVLHLVYGIVLGMTTRGESRSPAAHGRIDHPGLKEDSTWANGS